MYQLILRFQVVVYVEARRHEKAILSQQISIEVREKFIKLHETTVILVALLLSYCPSFITKAVGQVFVSEETLTDIEALVRFLISLTLIRFNSVLNPLIYAVGTRQFRVAFAELLLRKSYQDAKETF